MLRPSFSSTGGGIRSLSCLLNDSLLQYLQPSRQVVDSQDSWTEISTALRFCLWVLYSKESSSSGPTKLEVQLQAQFDGHNSQVWRVSWNITSTLLASSGDDGCVRLWKGMSVEWEPKRQPSPMAYFWKCNTFLSSIKNFPSIFSSWNSWVWTRIR